jgi:Holliday junction resolvase
MRTKGRTDDNQTAIVKALRNAGCSVAITSDVGGGFPDLVIGAHGKNYLLEVKDGNKPPSERKLTAAQNSFHGEWEGQVDIVYSVRGALEWLERR